MTNRKHMRSTMSQDELVALVQSIMDADGSEADLDEMLSQLKANVPHPSVSDLIYYPVDANLSAEHIVELALAYEPVILGRKQSTDS